VDQGCADCAAGENGEEGNAANRERYAERQRQQHQRDHRGGALRPGEAEHGDRQRTWKESDPSGKGYGAAVRPALRSQALHQHNEARDDDQAVADRGEGGRITPQHGWHLAEQYPQHQEGGEPRDNMQEGRGQRDTQAFSDTSFLPQEIGGKHGLAVTRREGVQGAEEECKCGGADAAGAQLGSERAQDASLQGAEIRHQPIAHGGGA
jgi:hypothetical protein